MRLDPRALARCYELLMQLAADTDLVITLLLDMHLVYMLSHPVAENLLGLERKVMLLAALSAVNSGCWPSRPLLVSYAVVVVK